MKGEECGRNVAVTMSPCLYLWTLMMQTQERMMQTQERMLRAEGNAGSESAGMENGCVIVEE